MDHMGVRHIALPVEDIGRALSFYSKNLGFHPYYETKPGEAWGMVSKSGTTISFLKFEDKKNIFDKSLEGHAKHFGICVESKDQVDAYYKKLQQIGAHSLKLHRDGSYGFYIQDSEGNFLEIIFIPLFPYLEQLKGKKIYFYGISSDLEECLKSHCIVMDLVKIEKLEDLPENSFFICPDGIIAPRSKILKVNRAFDTEPYFQMEKIVGQFFYQLRKNNEE